MKRIFSRDSLYAIKAWLEDQSLDEAVAGDPEYVAAQHPSIGIREFQQVRKVLASGIAILKVKVYTVRICRMLRRRHMRSKH